MYPHNGEKYMKPTAELLKSVRQTNKQLSTFNMHGTDYFESVQYLTRTHYIMPYDLEQPSARY